MSINECREIYREAFGSDGEFENRLFTYCFKYCRTLSIGGKTASMLFALPSSVMLLFPAETVISHLSASFDVPENISCSSRSRKYAATDEKIKSAGEILK